MQRPVDSASSSKWSFVIQAEDKGFSWARVGFEIHEDMRVKVLLSCWLKPGLRAVWVSKM